MIKKKLKKILNYVPLVKHLVRTSYTTAPITIQNLFMQKVLGFNRKVPWPVHFTSRVSHSKNINIGIGTAPGLGPNCYIQGYNGIEIGDYTIIAPGVGIISANHDINDYRRHQPTSSIKIGRYCWIGMNSVILPEVILGDHVIVGAGSVVTKSYPDGYCVLAGNPAKIIKKINDFEVVEYENKYKYRGYKILKN